MSLLLRSLLSLSIFSSSLVHADSEANPQFGLSGPAFYHLMQNKMIRDYFTYLQQEVIPTRFDSKIRNFFRDDLVLSELYRANADSADATLDEFLDQANTEMIRIRRFMGSEQARALHRMVVELAKALGFPKEAVDNIMIYVADGAKNAFTVSASKDRIIIVFQSELLEKMPLSEIRAVVGHELGHIVLGHTNLRRMNMFLISMLQMLFVKAGPGGEDPTAKLRAEFNHLACGNGCSLKHNSSPLMNLSSDEVKLQQVEQKVMYKLGGSDDKRNQLLYSYLSLAVEVMEEYLAPARAIKIVKAYRENLLAKAQDPEKFILPGDAQDFGFAMTHLLNAISRSQEVSSDRVSDSVVKRKYLASAFIRLLGLDKFDVKDRHTLIEQVNNQGEDVLNTMDREKLASHIGTSHPSSVLRIYLMNRMPSYPAVVMANPFSKLLLLNQYLLMEKGTSLYLSQIPVKTAEQQEQQQFFESHLQEVTAASEQTIEVILSLLKQRSSVVAHNPRLNDLIHFSLIQREQYLFQIHELQEQIRANAGDDHTVKAINKQIQMIRTVFMPQSQAFLGRVLQQVEGSSVNNTQLSDARIAALKTAMTSVDLVVLKAARQAQFQIDPSRHHWTKDPIAESKAPDFIVPRTIKPKATSEREPERSTVSLLKAVGCERILVGR